MLAVITISSAWLYDPEDVVVVNDTTVGNVLSKITLPDPVVTSVPALEPSVNAILKETEPSVSEAFDVYFAVQVFPLVFV